MRGTDQDRALVPSSAKSRERLLALTQHHRFGAYRMRIAPIYHCIECDTASDHMWIGTS